MGDRMALSSVVIEVDTRNARWRNKDEDHMLASRTLYRNMLDRINKDSGSTDCVCLPETDIKNLVEQHVREAEPYSVQRPSTKRSDASSSSKHTATRLYQPMSEQKPKRQRSPSPNDSSKRRALPKSAPEQDSEWAVREAGSSKPAPPKKVKSRYVLWKLALHPLLSRKL
ncbi:hypothetical protein DL93DRAFT_1004569 [Clavulina sp. PMI_390]|nr:hypothetical protein DL93DRAFT_1004569 [Clavulina sp. PMI_390]